MRAYDESYLHDAMDALGEMLDYAVVDCGHDADKFFEWFIVSGVATGFEKGNPRFVAGMSGIELAREVRYRILGKRSHPEATQPLDRSPEYWAGWIMAYYQWYRALRFEDMLRGGLAPSRVMASYRYHEADVSSFVAFADEILERSPDAPTPLATMRRRRGLTQAELASAAGTSTRMVQLYEQRRNNLAKASASTVVRLARALGCDAEDLLEPEAYR